MSDPTTPEPDPTPPRDGPLYPVIAGTDECAAVEGEKFPRRPRHGARGVLVVDRPAGVVYLLDADDQAGVFRGRARRPLAGDPGDLNPPRDNTDHVVRAAYESQYDVIAAPWAGDTPDDTPPAAEQTEAPPPPRKRAKRAPKPTTGGAP